MLSVVIVAGVVVIAVASFTDAVAKIAGYIGKLFPEDGFVIAGEIVPESGAAVLEHLAVTIRWNIEDDTAFQSSKISHVTPSDGENKYSIKLTKPPPDEVLLEIDGVKLGVGFIVAFGDVNQNGILDRDEAIVGGASKYAVTYLHGDLNAIAISPDGSGRNRVYTLLSIPQGYSLTISVPPEEHGFPVPFDDLVPVEKNSVNIVIPRDAENIRFPNWS